MSASALRRMPDPAAEPEPKRPVFDTDVAEPGLDLAATLRAITTKYGKTYQRLLLDLAKASFGPGRLSYDEFIGLRLFDDAWVDGADITQFVGLDAERRLWMAANNNSEWWGVMRNKLAVTTLLGGYGFPVIPTLALYSDAISMRGIPILRQPADLADFLRGTCDYPLFGKPMDSQRSLGSIGLEAYDSGSDCLVAGERHIPVDDFAAAVAEHYKGGYIFQRRIAPHAGVRALAGNRLATVRAITILTEEGPQLLRALWKIPAGDNVADNYWRTGNLLATLELETGRVVRVVRGTGLALQEVTAASRHRGGAGRCRGAELARHRRRRAGGRLRAGRGAADRLGYGCGRGRRPDRRAQLHARFLHDAAGRPPRHAGCALQRLPGGLQGLGPAHQADAAHRPVRRGARAHAPAGPGHDRGLERRRGERRARTCLEPNRYPPPQW